MFSQSTLFIRDEQSLETSPFANAQIVVFDDMRGYLDGPTG